MSLKLYIRDNVTGNTREYGTNCHDSLILQPDGSLHYENMQIMEGTEGPDAGYTFVLKDGTDPREDKECLKYGVEPYIDIGGEEHGTTCHTCKSHETGELCDCCIRNGSYADCYERASNEELFNRMWADDSEE